MLQITVSVLLRETNRAGGRAKIIPPTQIKIKKII